MGIFYQQPYELLEEPRVKKVRKEMGSEAVGMFLLLHYLVKKGNGMYPLEAVMMLADGRVTKERRLRRLLSQFDLFLIENGMVSMREGLSTTDFIHRTSIRKKVRQLTAPKEDYDVTLFPEDLRAMDNMSMENIKDEIRAQVMTAVENQG